MRIVDSSSRETRVDTLHVADGDVRPVPFSNAGKRYRIDTVTVERRRLAGESWTVRAVTTSGPVLKLNGEDSRNRTNERHFRHTPGSLAAIVDQLGVDS